MCCSTEIHSPLSLKDTPWRGAAQGPEGPPNGHRTQLPPVQGPTAQWIATLQAISRFISEPGTIRDADQPEVAALCERISRSDLMGAPAVRLQLAIEVAIPDHVHGSGGAGIPARAAMVNGLAR